MIQFTILGEPASLKNQRRLVMFGKRPAFIKSDKARSYEQTALLQIPEKAKQMLRHDVKVTMKIYYASRRPDLDEAGILDLLQAKQEDGQVIRRGVILNDRQVKEKHVYWGLDKANPRAEITVENL